VLTELVGASEMKALADVNALSAALDAALAREGVRPAL
jgi:hypothetical protein